MKTTKTIAAILLIAVISISSLGSYCAVSKPSKPKITVKNSAKGVKISWKKIKGATKYVVKYKKSTAKKFKTAYSGKKLSYTDDNLSPGTKYTFKVKAMKNKVSGSYSKKASILYLDQPTLHAEELLDMKGITLTWSKVKGAKGYRIYRSLKSKNSYTKIATIANASTKYYLDTTVKDTKTPTQINSYKYYIKAYNGSYTSAKSDIKSEIYGYVDTAELKNNLTTTLYLTIKKGETYKDIYQKLADNYVSYLFTWKSSDKKIAKVSDVGVITGVTKGTATLTASANYKNKDYKIKIVVTVS